MGRPAKKKSAAALATEKAKKTWDDVSAAYAKSKAPADLEKATKLRAAYDEAKRAERRDRFKTVAGLRVKKIIDTFDGLGACSAQSRYDYTEHDVAKAFAAITDSMELTRQKLIEALSRPKVTAEQPTGFAFD